MLGKLVVNFCKNPFSFIRRIFFKTLSGPLKYANNDDYNASNYWHDRFSKYGYSLKGAGDESISEKENEELYQKDGENFKNLCRREGFDFSKLNTLEIGCGSGFYTKILYDSGAKSYTGLDITDIFFNDFKTKYPDYSFIKKDITSDKLDGKFDLIIMIDVIEHIVNEDRFTHAMENIKNCLKENGIFIISPLTDKSKKRLFYLRSWSLDDLKKRFQGYVFSELIPFRYDYLLIIKKPL